MSRARRLSTASPETSLLDGFDSKMDINKGRTQRLSEKPTSSEILEKLEYHQQSKVPKMATSFISSITEDSKYKLNNPSHDEVETSLLQPQDGAKKQKKSKFKRIRLSMSTLVGQQRVSRFTQHKSTGWFKGKKPAWRKAWKKKKKSLDPSQDRYEPDNETRTTHSDTNEEKSEESQERNQEDKQEALLKIEQGTMERRFNQHLLLSEDIDDAIEESTVESLSTYATAYSDDMSKSVHQAHAYEYGDGDNLDVTYREFGQDPFDVMKLQFYDFEPMAVGKTDVVVIIEASTVSTMDCRIRQGLWSHPDFPVSLPLTPGFEFVGRILSCGPEVGKHNLKPGDRVASVTVCGGNARYITVKAPDLLKIPDDVDAAKAVSLIVTYMTAFQSLFIGCSNEERYFEDSLLDKSVLIVGGASLTAQAIIDLAFLAGARIVYATARENHHNFIESLGAIPLSHDHSKWLKEVRGRIDIVIDGVCSDNLKSPREAMSQDGKLVSLTSTQQSHDQESWVDNVESFVSRTISYLSSREHTYHLLESWDSERKLFKEDLEYLMEILNEGEIKPKIAARIPLRAVMYAQSRLQNERFDGVIVCEPWIK